MNRLLEFIEDRLGLVSAAQGVADHPVVGRPGLRHAFFPVLVYLFVQQAILGVVLATYYSPSVTDAWASTAYLQDQVGMGWFVRGMHYHGSSAFVVVVAMWIGQQVVHRGYGRRREFVWWGALGMLGLALAFGLTGNPLPWDQEGYWSILVELGVAEQTPGGKHLRMLIQGGAEAGNLTILRLYTLHVFVLPALFGALTWVVLRQRGRHHGSPDNPASDSVTYFPTQAFVDVTAVAVVVGTLVALTVNSHGAALLAPADPTETFQARPAWYFLFLYKLRMLFEGPMEPVATMVIPGAAAGFLFSVPFLERLLGAHAHKVVLGGTFAIGFGVLGLTTYSLQLDAADEDYQKAVQVAHKQADLARHFALDGVVPEGGPAVFFNDPQYKTAQLFKEHCSGCHSLGGLGGDEAPDLTDYGSRAWLAAFVRAPDDLRFFGNTDHKGDMEAYGEADLPEDQLNATLEYLVSLMGDPSMEVNQTLATRGKSLWDDELECNNCHEVEAGKDADGPNLLGRGSQPWVERVIADSSKRDLYGDGAAMPKFEGKLTAEEIRQLAAYVVGGRAK